MADTTIEFFSFLLAGLAIIASIITLWRNENFQKEQLKKQEEFSNQQQEHQQKFETELEGKIRKSEYIGKQLPDLIREFKDNREHFDRVIKSTEDSMPVYGVLKSKIDRGEIEFIKEIDNELYKQLNWINSDINEKLQRLRLCKQTFVNNVPLLWARHLRDNYKHGNFPVESLVDRIFKNAFPDVLNGDFNSIYRNFDSELKVELSSNITYFDPYNEKTPNEMINIFDMEKIFLPLTIQYNYHKYINNICKKDLNKKNELYSKISSSFSDSEMIHSYIYKNHTWSLRDNFVI
ncbi:hypothetical protein MUO93_10125, partial [Candidatus Bathyarchaeota archaeon]|nr:hypothetical protein [Candidatus Bathyarchaeota archaeon]